MMIVSDSGIFRKPHQTSLHPLGVSLLIILALLVFALPRRYATVPYLIAACFISPAQNLVLGGLSFYFLRILIIVGAARVLCRGEAFRVRWQLLDGAVLLWTIVGVTLYTIQQGTVAGIILKLGQSLDWTGAYVIARCLIRDRHDGIRVAKCFLYIAIPVAAAFVLEWITRYNAFSIFGGVPVITVEREGRLRCQGAFAHPILAGTFWAASLPAIVMLWGEQSVRRPLLIIGGLCMIGIVALTASSTPLLGLMAFLLGTGMFCARGNMRLVRWSLAVLLLALHLCMKAPVWNLIARIRIIPGSTGYYRYKLIDAAINHFGEWWLIGTTSVGHWGNDWGHYLDDITNQYVMEGVRGGIATLALFIVIIILAFRAVGNVRRHSFPKHQLATWSLGVMVFVHVVCFIAVTYFGQIVLLFGFQLAMIAAIDECVTDRSASSNAVALGV